ncbi:MAG TPA: phosphoenolpyruvate--protein phosphotransferase [Bacteroidetes bacterium]|nr:phosphoenolpyruvate--protein phosphotransferase [Bacteroidota bacterium]
MEQTSSSLQELILKGIPAAPGIAMGTAYLYSKHVPHIEMKTIAESDVEAEQQRVRTANARSEKELQKILAFAEQKLGSQSAKIFEAQIMILNDTILMGSIEKRIAKELKNAEYIVGDEINKYKRMMLASPDEYMHERARDVEDVMHRIVRNIQDQKLFSRLEGASIIVSESLLATDTVIFSRNQILGYAADLGGVTSHAAILSRSLRIPAVLGLRNVTKNVRTGDSVAIDGYAGTIAINPNAQTIEQLEKKAERLKAFEEQLTAFAPLVADTPDHKHIELSANIEVPEEVDYARAQGAAGIGLYRTEGTLLARQGDPSEEEQYEEYKKVAEATFPHPVIFRTFDIGGDKLAPGEYHEENPFLGWRGIRVSLDRPEMFLTQLRALLRASTKKNVRIMFPMIAKVSEVRRAKEFLKLAKNELKARGLHFDARIKIGVMIEVPSAAIMAEEIAAEVDFLSIGSNDLIQYLLAVDRDNAAVAPLYQQFNPAVLRTIKAVIDAGHRKNIWVGMCGEMGGDPIATILLVGMGIDELSVVPTVLPEIKKIIRTIKYKDAVRIADKVLTLHTEDEIREYLASVIKKQLPDIPLED